MEFPDFFSFFIDPFPLYYLKIFILYIYSAQQQIQYKYYLYLLNLAHFNCFLLSLEQIWWAQKKLLLMASYNLHRIYLFQCICSISLWWGFKVIFIYTTFSSTQTPLSL